MYQNIEHKRDETVCNDRSKNVKYRKSKLFLMDCSMGVAVACYLHSIHARLRDAYRREKG
jgi:hypothetical protein